MKKLKSFFIISFMLLNVYVMGQNRNVSGTVTSSYDNSPLPGVSVFLKGTTIGTNTDKDGNYNLNIPSNGTQVLVFSFIGMKTKEIILSGSDVLNVKMETDALNLDEVVVTALGIKREKKALGYSVQEVKGDDLTKANNVNLITSISAKVAGAQVISSSGSPGSSAYLRLRGNSSLVGDGQPLIVIDGVPFDNSQIYSGNPNDGDNNLLGSVNYSNRGIDINPNDIESISALKGPAATALYGTQAANGAILITRKKGGTGGVRSNITFSSGISFEKVNRLPQLQNKWVQGSYGNILWNGTTSWGAMADTLSYDDGDNPKNVNGNLVSSSDTSASGAFEPYDNVGSFFQTGVTYDNSLSLSGGNDMANYRFSIGNMNQKGMIPTSTFKRTSISIGGEAALTTKLKASGNVTYTSSGGRRVQQGSNVNGLMLDLLRTPINFQNSNGASSATDPSAYLYADGSHRSYHNTRFDNPYWTINQNPFVDKVDRIFGIAQVDFNVTRWLDFTYRVGTDIYSDRRNQFYEVGSKGGFNSGYMFRDLYNFRSLNSDAILRATRNLTTDLVGVLTLGHNFYNNSLDQNYMQGSDLLAAGFNDFSNAATLFSRDYESAKRNFAGYAAARLEYKNMLFLDLSGRREYSSTFFVNDDVSKYSFFYPSASLSFIVSEALGMSDNKILPFAKLRLNYATTAGSPSSNIRPGFTPAAILDGWTSGISGNGFSTSDLAIGAVLPERKTAFESGAELKFLRNRLGIDFTYYQDVTKDLITPVQIAASSGYTTQLINAGKIGNKGIELQLNATPIKNSNFTWETTVNFSRNKNKVIELAPNVDNFFLGGFEGSDIRAVVGSPFGVIWGYDYLKNENGDFIIQDDPNAYDFGYPQADTASSVLGDPNPDFLMGFGNNFSFRGFNLYFLIDWKKGGDIWNGTLGALTFYGRSANTENRGQDVVFDGVTGHINADGQVAHYDASGNEVLGAGGTNTETVTYSQDWYQDNGGGFSTVSGGFVEDGSYIKLREVALSYSIPFKSLKTTPIRGVDVGVFARNYLLHTKYRGIDPETSLTGSSNSQGMDYFNNPGAKSYGIQLKLNF